MKLKIKDLVTIGIFFVIYFVVMFGVGMIGIVPILFLIYPSILGIVSGVIIMLFMAKISKPWALFILGMLSPLIMFAMGHSYVVVVGSLVFIGLAEFFFRKGEFKSFKYNTISFAFFNCWISSSLMQMLLAKEKYIAIHEKAGVDPSYFPKLEALISWPSIMLVIIGAFIGGIIGAFIGKKMLKKHFKKAGIV